VVYGGEDAAAGLGYHWSAQGMFFINFRIQCSMFWYKITGRIIAYATLQVNLPFLSCLLAQSLTGLVRFPICEVLCGTSSTFCPFDMISRETLIIPPAIDSDVARIREQRRTRREQTAAANVENEEHMLALIKL
jgi:hypothetical protein